MDNEENKIERWIICERYKNYKSNNFYKDPVQFRPHPENVVRDVFMYHIYHNEGKLCNDDLIQYIKNKIINDLNEIFMLYEYAPDAISTIKRLMSSKYHLGTEDTYNELLFHALTIRDAIDIIIEQISNVLIKNIPEPLDNIKFDVIMKDDVKDLVNDINKSHKQMINNKEEERKMNQPINTKGNKVQDNQRFQVGDLVSFEKHGWYYQSLIHGVCYHEDSKKWSYVIVAFGEFHHIVGDDVDKLTLLKKSKTSIDTVVKDNKVEQVYRGYITKSQEIKETLLSAVQLIEGISEDDILNLHSLNDYDCDIIETTCNFIKYIIYYVCSYSDNDYIFDEDKSSIVQLKDNGNQRINTPLYEFIEDELKPIIEHQIKLKLKDLK